MTVYVGKAVGNAVEAGLGRPVLMTRDGVFVKGTDGLNVGKVGALEG